MNWAEQLAEAMRQVDDCLILVRNFVMPWYGASEFEFPTPIPPAVGMLYTAHESPEKWTYQGKVIYAPARFLITNYPEISLKNLTCKQGDDEVGRINVFPYHVRSHHWAAQQAFWEGKAWVEPLLAKSGFAPFDQLAVYDQLSLLLLQRSVGLGCVKGLLRKAAAAVKPLPLDHVDRLLPITRMEKWLSSPGADTTPFDGSQTTQTVMLRFAWCTRMIDAAPRVGLGGLPLLILPPAPRPPDIVPMPKDWRTNMKVYSRQARRQGPMPTGPWPAGA